MLLDFKVVDDTNQRNDEANFDMLQGDWKNSEGDLINVNGKKCTFVLIGKTYDITFDGTSYHICGNQCIFF